MSLPPSRLQALRALRQATEVPQFLNFLDQVLQLVQMPSTHAQIAAVKSVVASFLDLVRNARQALDAALSALVELLFLENSAPLHRSLLSSLSQLPQDCENQVKETFERCYSREGGVGHKKRSFALAAVASSLINLPKPGVLKRVTEHCSPLVVESISYGVQSLLRDARQGERPTPGVMDECQEAMSTLYYMLQHFPGKLLVPCAIACGFLAMPACANEPGRDSSAELQRGEGEVGQSEVMRVEPPSCGEVSTNGSSGNVSHITSSVCHNKGSIESVFNTAVGTILDVLQSEFFSRECMVAAGVALSAASQLHTNYQSLAVMLANSLFSTRDRSFALLSENGGILQEGSKSMLEAAVFRMRGTNVAAQINKFTDFGRLCLFRGLLTAIPRFALNVNLFVIPLSRLASRIGGEKERDFHLNEQGEEEQVWTLLFDGILPALCTFCENSVDSHFKFHSVTAIQICLQQIKASMTMHITTAAMEDLHRLPNYHGLRVQCYCPFPDVSIRRILQIVWNNWEDPLTQTVKQVQIVFDLLVDVHFLKSHEVIPEYQRLKGDRSGVEDGASKEVGAETFLRQIAADLLAVGGHRKGRYVPLASLALRLGAKNMLDMNPDLLFQTVDAMVDDDVCCSASTFLKSFLERLREDCWSAEGGVMEGDITFRRLCMPPIIAGIVCGNARLRTSLTIYALPVALQIDGDCILPMLAFALAGNYALVEEDVSWCELEAVNGLPQQLTSNQRVTLLISVLKVARSLALMEGGIYWFHECEAAAQSEATTRAPGNYMSFQSSQLAVVHIKGHTVHVPVALLELAVTHIEDSLRVDAAEVFCLNPKTAMMPSKLELELLRISIPLNMRCSSNSFRMKWTSLFKKFFLRVRTAIERQLKVASSSSYKDGYDKPFCGSNNHVCDNGVVVDASRLNIKACLKESENDDALHSAVNLQELQSFMQWFSRLLILSMYPSAPYERKNMAMELFGAMLDVWSLARPPDKKYDRLIPSASVKVAAHYTYNNWLLSEDASLLILGAVVDSWDKLRESACKLLMCYPNPLPGLESSNAVQKVLKWAKNLVNSPRVRESDAGALVLRLVFQKYVVELGWVVKLHPTVQVSTTNYYLSSMTEVERAEYNRFDESAVKIGLAIVEYLESLNDWLEWGIAEGERDLLRACQHSFVHGVLLTLRYTMDELDWSSNSVHAAGSQLREALSRLLCLLLRVTSVALWVVSVDALNIPGNFSGSTSVRSLENTLFFKDDEVEDMDLAIGAAVELEDCVDDGIGVLAPGEQVIMVGCWLAMKEVSLLLGTVTRKVPLPGCDNIETDGQEESLIILDLRQLNVIGEHFLHVLLSMKHNGAIDKTRAGFVALCNRLLCSSDPRLNKMPELWLQQLMQHTAAKGQTVDDLLRRSAGIPAAFLALFLAEPEGAPKKLLPTAMRWLIDLAKDFLARTNGVDGSGHVHLSANIDLEHGKSQDSDLRNFPCMEEKAAGLASKARNEGVVPTVHAFNAVRVTFHDTNLVTDTSAFCAEGLITSIQAFSSHQWEVRNAATLAFTALVHRTVGFLNVHKRESARRAITGFEFFHRYPSLHPYLLQELRSATLQLEQDTVGGLGKSGKVSKTLHPSLGPVLIILSRLKPSIINTRGDDWLCPSAFMPYVSRCATQSNLKVRMLASRALAPLVSIEKLCNVLCDIAEGLPKHGDFVMGKAQPSRSRQFSFNTLHGLLLQLHILLTVNCINLPDLGTRRNIVSSLSVTILECFWLGTARLCYCPMVTSAFLQVVHGLIEVAETCSAPSISQLKKMFVSSCAECLDDSDSLVTKHGELWDATKLALREKTGQMYFTETLLKLPLEDVFAFNRLDLVTGRNDLIGLALGEFPVSYLFGGILEQSRAFNNDIIDSVLQRLKSCLLDPMYEVRYAVLKVLHKFLKIVEMKYDSQKSSQNMCGLVWSILMYLHPLLMECLIDETHPCCSYRILQNCFSLCNLEVKVQEDMRQRTLMFVENATHCGSHLKLVSSERTSERTCKTLWSHGLFGLEHWRVVLKLFKSGKQLKNKEIALRCLGCCIRGISEQIRKMFDSTSSNQSCTNQDSKDAQLDHLAPIKEALLLWLELIQRHSAANEPVTLRRASAEAIVVSGLLEDAKWVGSKCLHILPIHGFCTCLEVADGEFLCATELQKEAYDLTCINWYAGAVLDVWFVCIKLLEDEDLDLRQQLAIAVQNINSSSVCSAAALMYDDLVPAQVEKVIHLSFEWLTVQFGDWIVYLDHLASWVLKAGDATGLILKDGDLVRRLFDKELDNHHEEGMIFTQLCCLHLSKLLNDKVEGSQLHLGQNSNEGSQNRHASCKCSFGGFVRFWQKKFLEQAESCAEKCVALQGSMEWVGGVTNHQDVFKALYPLLLGLLTFVGPAFFNDDQQCERRELLLRMTKLTAMMKPLLSNLLISNLFLKLVATFELKLGCDLGASVLKTSRCSAHLEEFNPLFLLK